MWFIRVIGVALKDSEVILVPVATFVDPFRQKFGYECYLVLCEIYDKHMRPMENNYRNVKWLSTFLLPYLNFIVTI